MGDYLQDISKLMESTQPGEVKDLLSVVFSPEMKSALVDLAGILKSTDAVIIGGLLLGVYARPRTTWGIDVMILSDNEIDNIAWKLAAQFFKRTSTHLFTHKKTGVLVEFVTPEHVKISPILVKHIISTAHIDKGTGLKITSKEGTAAAKLQRGILRDQSDIVEIAKAQGPLNLTGWPITAEQQKEVERLNQIAAAERQKGL